MSERFVHCHKTTYAEKVCFNEAMHEMKEMYFEDNTSRAFAYLGSNSVKLGFHQNSISGSEYHQMNIFDEKLFGLLEQIFSSISLDTVLCFIKEEEES